MMKVKQGDSESLLNYLEIFNSERNVMRSLFWQKLLDGFVENTQDYNNLQTSTNLESQRLASKRRTMDRLWVMLCIHDKNHKIYESLLVEFWKAYANKQCELYPEDLHAMIDTMRLMPAQKKRKPGNGNKKMVNK